MLQSRMYTVVFSFRQPEVILDTLLPILHQVQELPDFKSSQAARQESRTILLIDEQAERAQYITYLLQANGYQIQVVANPIDAFTLYLRGSFVPLAILLGTEQTSNRFFLTRLLQQVTQKYNWNPPGILLGTRVEAPVQQYQLPAPKQLYTDPLPELSLTPLSQALPAPIPPLQQQLVPQAQTQPLPVSPLPAQRVQATVSASATQPRTQPEYASRPVRLPGSSPVLLSPLAPTAPVTSLPVPVTPHLPMQMSPVVSEEAMHSTMRSKKVSLTGLSIGRYHMQTLLGNGPLGEVYRTYDRLREQDIALKAVQLDIIPSYMNQQEFMSDTNLFQQEIDMLNTLKHSHILVPLATGKSYISGSPFIYKTMRYSNAGSLSSWLYKLGNAQTLSVAEVAHVVMQVADALQLAHSRHVTYQNFKLSNLLISDHVSKARQLHILLTDFALIQNGKFVLKTPSVFPYMAPECWQGQSLPASDQYGLAAVAYELLVGRPLFSGQSEHIIRQLHQTMQPQPLSTHSNHVSPSVEAVILRALAKRPEERFPSIMAFAEALQKS